MRIIGTKLAWIALVGLLALPATTQEEEDEATHAASVRSNYTKFEHRVPMRDGVRLFTSVYRPNDTSRDYPILMVRTPYGVAPYGADRYREKLGPSNIFDRERFIFVFQDVRGKYMSEGTFDNMRPHLDAKRGRQDVDESSDTYDTIEWLLQNVPGHNGKVGLWGISYPGFYSSAGMIDGHPALVAVSPQAPIADWFIGDDMHHNGAFSLNLAFNFFASFGRPRPELTTERAESFDHATPDGYEFFLGLGPLKNVNERHFKGEIEFWNAFVEHPNYDAYWQARNLLPRLKDVKAAVLVVGGWFDTEDLYGALETYEAVEVQNPGTYNKLVMGPWSHGGWNRTAGDRLGDAEFGFETSRWYQDEVEWPFFSHFLKGDDRPELPEALVFETGANRWRRFDGWPPPAVAPRKLFLREGGALAFEASEGDTGADDYVSDPQKPVPYTMEITTRWARDYMAEDQRFAARRPDVLVYRTDVLREDLTLAGPVQADLWVSTTGTDADFIVKVIDVYPDEIPGRDDADDDDANAEPDRGGQQTLVRWEVLRGRFRDGFETPKPFVPGEPTRVRFGLRDLLHTWKRGHRLMVQVQSTCFPFIDRNPQKFVPNIFLAEEADFIRATHTVYRSKRHASHLEVGVLE